MEFPENLSAQDMSLLCEGMDSVIARCRAAFHLCVKAQDWNNAFLWRERAVRARTLQQVVRARSAQPHQHDYLEPASQQELQRARDLYACSEARGIELDANALSVRLPQAVWVQAWLRLPEQR
ncbi:hypothetical protein [Azohydromonas lata]|uniref:hypothetical protein n=1 Tax=Azohydromonas lata TaxID=45677 RepID=UPI00082FE1F5|nr:hypothetical protein [Azohydromonas lata]